MEACEKSAHVDFDCRCSCKSARSSACVWVLLPVFQDTHTHTQVLSHMHTHAHTRTHMHTHAHTRTRSLVASEHNPDRAEAALLCEKGPTNSFPHRWALPVTAGSLLLPPSSSLFRGFRAAPALAASSLPAPAARSPPDHVAQQQGPGSDADSEKRGFPAAS
eukprot:1568579-Rhodomonas_salina.1